VARPVGWVQGDGELCDFLAQLFIHISDSDQDGVFRFRDKDKVNKGGGWEQSDRGLLNRVLGPEFLLT
jgi:hypothetical protein